MHYNIFERKIIARTCFSILILCNSIFTYSYAFTLSQYDSAIKEVSEKFNQDIRKNPQKTLILSGVNDFEDRLNDASLFRNDSLVHSLPVYPVNIEYYKKTFSDTSDVSVDVNNESIIVKSKSDDFCITTNGNDTILLNNIAIVIIGEKNNKKHYNLVVIKPLNYDKFKNEFKLLAFLNSKKWIYIDLSKNN